jgi:hypothetical protein
MASAQTGVRKGSFCLHRGYNKFQLELYGLGRQCGIWLTSMSNESIMFDYTQQTRNHFWSSWHVSYWFIIGTAPPVCVFMCIHVNTHVLPVVTNFERVWHVSYWVRIGMVSLVRVITWKTCDFTINTCRHNKFVHRIQWIHIWKHVNWASWTREFTYRTCEITGRCLLGIFVGLLKSINVEKKWLVKIVQYLTSCTSSHIV